jgi:hypothetical protein
MISKYFLIPSLLFAFIFILSGCENQIENKTKHKPCHLTSEQMPPVSNFRLGSNLSEVKNRFPELEIPNNNEILRVLLLSSSNTLNFSEEKLNALANKFIVDSNKHPEFRDIEVAELTFLRAQLSKISVFYTNKPEWNTPQTFFEDTTRRLKFPYTPDLPNEDSNKTKEENTKLPSVSCSPNGDKSPINSYSFLHIGFKELDGKDYPYVYLWNIKGLQIEQEILEKEESNKAASNSNKTKSNPQSPVEESAPQKVNQVEIANVLVKVGQDAYISQDRLEQHLIKTVGDTDAYSYQGKIYEITYGLGERGAYFVKSIKIIE